MMFDDGAHRCLMGGRQRHSLLHLVERSKRNASPSGISLARGFSPPWSLFDTSFSLVLNEIKGKAARCKSGERLPLEKDVGMSEPHSSALLYTQRYLGDR